MKRMPAQKKKIRDQRSKIKIQKQKKGMQEFIDRGLLETEVRARHEQYGYNSIERKRETAVFTIFVNQFKSPLIYILVFAAAITIVLHDFVDTAVIGIAVVANTILGFYQEYKAQRALAALRELLSTKATVIREGIRQTIESTDVVPGDICLVGLGERIPADGVVLKENDFAVNEAILTGESVPVHKQTFRSFSADLNFLNDFYKLWNELKREQKAFAGTTVASGAAIVLIVTIGSKTEVGKIAASLAETREEPTPLQKRIHRFSNQLAVFIGIVALLIFVTGLLVGESFLSIFTISVAVAVAAIPEGLAVSLTVILAIGMQRILRRKSLVRKLVAAETLGSITVICADKTGTLTEGVMRVTEVDFEDEEQGMRAAILTNDQRDPLEVAMWNWVREVKGQDPQRIVDTNERIDSIPFSPEEKFTAKLYRDRVYVMGAPEVILSFCSMQGSKKIGWIRKLDEHGVRGLRIVGLAMRRVKKGERKLTRKSIRSGLTWLGIVVYEDPVRRGVAAVLSEAKKAGIDVKVITGDYRVTAEAVLERLGLLSKAAKLQAHQSLVMEGEELERLSADELRGRVAETVLFARTDPVQKLKIVEALQVNGEVVAMTGDGVNDAPALKRADIGLVVSGATDVAKETADMVLLDDNFATIVAAVEEGRGIFTNLRKVILYLLSDSFSEVVLVMGSLLLGIPLPLSAAQILWINLVTDGFPQLALTVEPKDRQLMNQPPRDPNQPLVDLEIKLLIFLISGVTGIFTLGAFYIFWTMIYGVAETARTVVFAMLGIDSLIYVFSARSLQRPIWQTNLISNPWLILAVFVGLGFQLIALYTPFFQRLLETHALSGLEWLVVVFEAIVVIGIIETVKWWFLRKKQRLQQELAKIRS